MPINGKCSSIPSYLGNASISYYQCVEEEAYCIGDNGYALEHIVYSNRYYFRASGFILESTSLNQSKDRLGQGDVLVSGFMPILSSS